MTDRDPFSPLDKQEECVASGDARQQLDAVGGDEVIMPIPDDVEPLRKALTREQRRKPNGLWWYWDANGDKSFAVARFDHANGKTYLPYC